MSNSNIQSGRCEIKCWPRRREAEMNAETASIVTTAGARNQRGRRGAALRVVEGLARSSGG
jgi:hypothetical protein